MKTYQQKQEQLFDELENQFRKGSAQTSVVEATDDYVDDKRICLTGVIFLSENLQEQIVKKIIEPLQQADGNQYYYEPAALHLTIQNIRTVNYPPLFNDEDIEIARTVFRKIIPRFKPFTFALKGLFELPTSLGIRGYSDKMLGTLTRKLRAELKVSSVPDNKKYASDNVIFGNVSICRYISNPSKDFMREIQKLKDIDIGDLIIDKVSLITTNAVCHSSKTEVLEEYLLGG
ncbi:2'-5' RNA ligase family protein [Patescibacteria group bacterium]